MSNARTSFRYWKEYALRGELIAVRHAQSLANKLFSEDPFRGKDLGSYRDADVPLTGLGRSQAVGLGMWLAERHLDLAYSSPYVRATESLKLALAEVQSSGRPTVRIDERIRDREMGILELMHPSVIAAEFPREAARRKKLGEFYYRPPGGESLADVAARLRSFLRDFDQGRRTLVMCHDAVVLMLRFVTEDVSESDLARIPLVANASASIWRESKGGQLRLAKYDFHAFPG